MSDGTGMATSQSVQSYLKAHSSSWFCLFVYLVLGVRPGFRIFFFLKLPAMTVFKLRFLVISGETMVQYLIIYVFIIRGEENQVV